MARAMTKAQEKAMAEAADLFADDAGAGQENVGAGDLAIPFLTILQSNSPQCKRSEGAYIQGAEEGMILNTVTEELFNGEEGIPIIPCGYEKYVVEWVPRDQGGGLVGQHKPSAELQSKLRRDPESSRMVGPNGNHFVDTAYHYVIAVDEENGKFVRAVMSFSSTQLKASRRWNSIMSERTMTRDGQTFTLPSFAFVYKFSTEPQSNVHGSWMGWKFVGEDTPDFRVPDKYGKDAYLICREFAKQCKEGLVQTSAPPEEAPTASADGDGVI